MPTHRQQILELAQFRYRVRKYLRFSELATRSRGITPLQYQLLLGTAGFTERGWATISELAEFLQIHHHGVVALVNRSIRAGLVRKERCTDDRRMVRVDLTSRGRRLLLDLSSLHAKELRSMTPFSKKRGKKKTSKA